MARQLRDELDEPAYHFYVSQEGEIAACARLNLRRDGPLECEDQFEMERFRPAFPDRVSMTSRLVVHPRLRGSHLLMQLTCAMYEFGRECGLSYDFLDCHTRLLPIYSRLGYRIYKNGFKHPKYIYVIPMVLVGDDVEQLEHVKSPFAPIARRLPHSTEWRDLLCSQFPEAARTFVSADLDAAGYWDLLRTRLLEPTATFERCDIIGDFTPEETRLLLSHGHVVACRRGDPVLGAGEAGREMFLILEGSFRVLAPRHGPEPAQDKVLKILAPGDIFGEVGFLTEGVRSASVRAMEDAKLLVLNAKEVDRLVATQPGVATKVFRNLARIVATRLRDAIGF